MIWYVAVNGMQKKMPEEVLIYKIENGEISPETLVVNAEIKNWTPLEQTMIWKENANNSVVANHQNQPTPQPKYQGPSPYNQQQQNYIDSQSGMQSPERNKGLSIMGLIFGIAGIFVFSIVFGVLSLIFGIIALVTNSSEKGEMTKAIWQYKNKARGFGMAATILGIIEIIYSILNIFGYIKPFFSFF